jgi:hypothetical protein
MRFTFYFLKKKLERISVHEKKGRGGKKKKKKVDEAFWSLLGL